MKIRQTAVCVVLSCLLSSCAPVPSYSVDPYIGSLKQCLDIQGTYESTSFYTSSDRYLRSAVLVVSVLPESFMKKLIEKDRKGEFKYFDTDKDRTFTRMRTWVVFKFLDDQRLAIDIFNELGQEVRFIHNMKEPVRDGLLKMEWEELTCNASSWQKSHSRATASDGQSFKERRFVKITKTANGSLIREGERDFWSGRLGLYTLRSDLPNVRYDLPSGKSLTYHRKVDLTVEDIRANNEKTKKAIAQYDEFVTSPPQ